MARALNKLFLAQALFSDAPEFNGRWIDRLYSQVGISRAWRLEDSDMAIGSIMRPEYRTWLNIVLDDPRPHRADGDAKALAILYMELRRRRFEVRAHA